jgi:hypothetical protein
MYCLKCNYSLKELVSRQCPECGKAFDPNDSKTFLKRPKRSNRRLLVMLCYLVPLSTTPAFWLRHSAIDFVTSLQMGAYQASGPFSFFILENGGWGNPKLIWITFATVWTGWLTLVLLTRLRHLHYAIHVLFGFLWCFAGCPAVGLMIT